MSCDYTAIINRALSLAPIIMPMMSIMMIMMVIMMTLLAHDNRINPSNEVGGVWGMVGKY